MNVRITQQFKTGRIQTEIHKVDPLDPEFTLCDMALAGRTEPDHSSWGVATPVEEFADCFVCRAVSTSLERREEQRTIAEHANEPTINVPLTQPQLRALSAIVDDAISDANTNGYLPNHLSQYFGDDWRDEINELADTLVRFQESEQ